MDHTFSRCSMILRQSSSSRLLSRTVSSTSSFATARNFSYSRQLTYPPEDSNPSRPSGQSKSRPFDSIERQKAADREQWIKDLNEAIPNWSSPKTMVPRRLNRNGDDLANAFGVNFGNRETKASPSTSSEQHSLPKSSSTDATQDQESSLVDGNTIKTSLAPLPTRNIPLYEAKTSVQAFAERVNAADYDLNLSPRAAYRIPIGSGAGSKETELTRSLQSLSARTVQNRVQLRFNRQRFHERPGLKRKRLKKERWRRHFSDSFRTICARVGRLSRQGW